VRSIVIAALVAVAVSPAAALAAPVLSKDQPIGVGERVITLDQLEHWARIAARSDDSPTRREHFVVAGRVLIGMTWIEAEAERQGVEVSDARVDRALRRQIREAFPHGGLRRFLRETGQTRRDIKVRVRIDLLSDILRRRAIGDAKTPAGQQRRLERFVAEFRARWRAQTLCTPRFANELEDCSNGPQEPPPPPPG